MKKLNLSIISAVMFFIAVTSCSKISNQSSKIETELDSVSYALGVSIGENLKKNNNMTEINGELFKQALEAAIAGEETQIDAATGNNLLQTYFEEKHVANLKEEHKENLEAGIQYLEENKETEGVVVLPSGVQYRIIEEGSGETPDAADKVKVHYHGTLVDGTVFDSSVERGEPAEFAVNQVIPGWTEVLQLMPVGSKWEVVIPQEMAYGWRVRPGGKIDPFSTLIFEVELMDIVEENN
jgi:FKBP-type peptidyl-prolyl cis-trans isomerase FklB